MNHVIIKRTDSHILELVFKPISAVFDENGEISDCYYWRCVPLISFGDPIFTTQGDYYNHQTIDNARQSALEHWREEHEEMNQGAETNKNRAISRANPIVELRESGLNYKDIAAEFNITPETARQIVCRHRKRLANAS